ncbi:MAG: hypothetical protein U5K76_02885 [Woeseiaceae bacterium]|nr:hypothetical protein [Woeseiaceae bacterium]
MVFKLLRGAEDADERGKVAIVGRNPDAVWFNDYDDRVIYDEAGLFTDEADESADRGVASATG